jgi:hypothetical protein
LPLPVQQTPSAFHRPTQRNAFRSRRPDVPITLRVFRPNEFAAVVGVFGCHDVPVWALSFCPRKKPNRDE